MTRGNSGQAFTRTERDALSALVKGAGPVAVMTVDSEPAGDARECVTCGHAVRYLSEREAARIADAGWIHAGTGQRRAPGSDPKLPRFDFHWAEPVPECPGCGSVAWVATDEAWGISHDCADCGRHDYMSIGD